jgi:cobalt/nickel transport system ATP-binding protein
MSPALIEAAGLHYAYQNGAPALKDVSLCVDDAEILAVIGANGAGKSTLLLLLGGLVKAHRGSLRWRGAAVDERTLRRETGLLLQDPEDQIFAPTVVQDVAFGLVQRRMPEPEARLRAEVALCRMGIAHLASRPIRALSLGEKKRTALAGLIVLEPALLLLDEPTAGLDHAGVQTLEATLDDLHRQGTAIVFSTHDAGFAARFATRVAVLHAGNLIARGDAGAVLGDEELLTRAGLAIPDYYAVAAEMARVFPCCQAWPWPTHRGELRQFIDRLASQLGEQPGNRLTRRR